MDQGLYLPGLLFLFLSVPSPSPCSHQTSALQLYCSNAGHLTPELPQPCALRMKPRVRLRCPGVAKGATRLWWWASLCRLDTGPGSAASPTSEKLLFG